MDVLLCQCNSNIQQFALEPLGFKSKLPEQVTKLCLFRHFVFLRDSLLIYPKSKVQLTFITFIEMIRNSPQPCPILKTLYSVIYNFMIPFNNNSTYNN